MINSLINLLTFFILVCTGWMLTIPSVKAANLEQHIAKYCKTGCVDASTLVNTVDRAAKRFGFDKRAMLAIIHVESKFKIKAKNGSSVGLTQVLLRYHKGKFMKNDYYDVQENVFAGSQVFKECLTKHKGVYPKAFSCYNGYQQGDPKYRSKTSQMYEIMRDMELPTPSQDPLRNFLVANNFI